MFVICVKYFRKFKLEIGFRQGDCISHNLVWIWIILFLKLLIKRKLKENLFWLKMKKRSTFLQLYFSSLQGLMYGQWCIKMKINLNFYFHTSSWCLKGLHKTFWGTTKKCENKNLREFFPFVRNFLFFSVIFFSIWVFFHEYSQFTG